MTSTTPGIARSGATCSFRFVADDADDRAIDAAAEMRAQSECFDPFDDVLDLIVRHVGF